MENIMKIKIIRNWFKVDKNKPIGLFGIDWKKAYMDSRF
jgi:hypothetical protein